jgi:hypothetical protein
MKLVSARLVAAALLLLGGMGGALHTANAEPGLTHVTPGAVVPGNTTEITLHGVKLDGQLRAWTSFPADIQLVAGDRSEKDRKQAGCKITLSPEVPIGIGGIVVANDEGLSDVVYLMIDDLPNVMEGGSNHAPDSAQAIALPAGVDGQCDGTLPDYFRFAAQAGQRISCEVVAARLGWDFDPLVRVLDASGNELLLADDDPATGPDTRFVFTAPAGGDYLIELRDNRYKPGGRYRLRLGNFPLVTTPLPLVAQNGVPTDISFRGPLVDADLSLSVLPIGRRSPREVFELTVRQRGKKSGWTTLAVSELPVFRESNTRGDISTLTVPCLASGVLDINGQRDLFSFSAAKGNALRFRGLTRSAGSPAILSLRVRDSAGRQLAEAPVTDSDEPILNFTPPADGLYQLAVEELAGRSGSDFTYAVECYSGPQFSLLLKNDKNNRLRYGLPASGAFFLDVQCQRAGYDGPIELTVESPRSGWQIVNNVIPAKANEVRAYLVPPLDLAAGELCEMRIVGRGAVNGGAIKAAMTTTLQLRAARPQTPYPPAWHDGTILASRTTAKASFYAIAFRNSNVELPGNSGQATLTLDFERTDPKFKDTPLTVVPIGLPAGVTAEVKRNGNGPKESYEIVLKGSTDLRGSEHTFRYFTYAELSGQGRGAMSGDIRLHVATTESDAAKEKDAR